MKKKKRSVLKPGRELTFMQMVESLPKHNINRTWNLKKLYYQSKCELSPAEKRGIKAGLRDIRQGRVVPHEEAMERINKKFESLFR